MLKIIEISLGSYKVTPIPKSSPSTEALTSFVQFHIILLREIKEQFYHHHVAVHYVLAPWQSVLTKDNCSCAEKWTHGHMCTTGHVTNDVDSQSSVWV